MHATHKSRPRSARTTRGRQPPAPRPPAATPWARLSSPWPLPPPRRSQWTPARCRRPGHGQICHRRASSARRARRCTEPARRRRQPCSRWSSREEARRHSNCAREAHSSRLRAQTPRQPVCPTGRRGPRSCQGSVGRVGQAVRGWHSSHGRGGYAPPCATCTWRRRARSGCSPQKCSAKQLPHAQHKLEGLRLVSTLSDACRGAAGGRQENGEIPRAQTRYERRSMTAVPRARRMRGTSQQSSVRSAGSRERRATHREKSWW